MLEKLISYIESIKSKPPGSQSEEATKQGMILPIINILGWDVFDVDEVYPEYELDKKRVDYSLRIGGEDKVFIEAKHSGVELDNHQEQLLTYAFKAGVEIAILTNGISWWFYLPMLAKKVWEERRFYTIHLPQQKPTDVAEHFVKFLSRTAVNSGSALRTAQEVHQSQTRLKTLSDTIPQAWNEIIAEPESLLFDLIAEETEKICGYKPSASLIESFIEQNREQFHVDSEKILNGGIKTPSKIAKQKKKKAVSDIDQYQGKKVTAFNFEGAKYSVEIWKDVIVKICELMYDKHQDNFSTVYNIKGKKNVYFSKKEKELTVPRAIGKSGMFVETNFSAPNIAKLTKQIVNNFGYSSDSVSFELLDDVSKATNNKNIDVLVESAMERISIHLDIPGWKRLSKGRYFSETSQSNLICLTSKLYDKNQAYWFSINTSQVNFLSEQKKAYLSLVCGDATNIVLLSYGMLSQYIKKFHSAKLKSGGTKYHIHIFERGSDLLMGQPTLTKNISIKKHKL